MVRRSKSDRPMQKRSLPSKLKKFISLLLLLKKASPTPAVAGVVVLFFSRRS
jgi:hypothetical protein